MSFSHARRLASTFLLLTFAGAASVRTDAFLAGLQPKLIRFVYGRSLEVLRSAPGATLANQRVQLLTQASSSVETETAYKHLNERPFGVQRRYETFLWNLSDTKQYRINYRCEGPLDGDPILLVHGFGASVNHFRYNIPLLVKEGYRVYAIDLLGFGASDKPKDEAYSIELFVQLLTDFIQDKYTESKPWVIAGNSIGGLCSLSVAEKIPHMIQAVVLFNTSRGMSVFRYEDVPRVFRPVLRFFQKVVLGPKNGPRFFKNFKTRENVQKILISQGVYRDPKNVNDELLEILLGPSDDEGAEDVFLAVFAGPPGPLPETILPKLSCPILAVWGGKDPWAPVSGGPYLSGSMFGQLTKDFTLEVLPEAGHCPHDECPEAVHEKLVPFLDAAKIRYKPPPRSLDDASLQVGDGKKSGM